MLGLGVMLHRLGGNSESVAAYQSAVGKVIAAAALTPEDTLQLRFTDGTGIEFVDDGQSCCEHRYMRTDDKPEEFIGATFTGAEIKEGPETEGDTHEVEFLEIQTNRGVFTMASHNEHNGYYGGFCVVVKPLSV